MSFDVAITACGLSKVFPVYQKPHHRLMQMLVPRRYKRRWYEEFHALRQVDIAVRKGETVGIVGRNGSGKSTLLQILCGTLAPTAGTLDVRGRIAALLELGAGFNPEFTGRENVYLYGALLGLTRQEVEAHFRHVVEFADIGDFIDRPVKTYSSGMYVRLAFAVAINVEPDILIVDEALAVGDEAFQRKCFAKIRQIRDAGATILFVSHSAATIVELCDRAILLDHGEVLGQGAPKEVIARYQRLLYAPPDRVAAVREEVRGYFAGGDEGVSSRNEADWVAASVPSPSGIRDEAYWDEGLVPNSTVVYENRGAIIEDPHLQTPDGRRVNVLSAGCEYVYVYRVRFSRAAVAVRCGMMIKTVTGVEVAGGVTAPAEEPIATVAAGAEVEVKFRFRCLLAPGPYFMNAGVLAMGCEGEEYLDRRLDVAMFKVLPEPRRLATGIVDLEVRPTVELRETTGV